MKFQALYLFLLLELTAVSYLDLKYNKISNYWSVINLVIFIILFFIYPDFFILQLSTFYFPVGILLAGFLLFGLNIMGAGDAKYLFTFYLLVPCVYHEALFYELVKMTVVVSLCLLVWKVLKSFSRVIMSVRSREFKPLAGIIFGKKFAYAPVLFLAWIFFGWSFRDVIW